MKDIKQKVEALLSKMTLEEKVGQLQQVSATSLICGGDIELAKEYKDMGTMGSFLHVLGEQTEEFIAPSKDSRLQIPPIFGIDAIHGHALLKESTIFPSQLAMACSFNEELIQEMGNVTGKEVNADGLDWIFSPVLCLGRDLRWGRVDETFGEDAYLASRLGSAIIKGYQTNDQVAACAKHYLGYGEATGGRDSYDTEITERKAREVFLKPFKAAVDAGCMSFMTGYGSIDGEPLTTSHRYLTEILKDEYGFEGFVVTDWDNFYRLYAGQHTVGSMEEACKEGLLAGNDMCMFSLPFYEAAIRAVKAGQIPEEVVDNAVRRILTAKVRMGLLDGDKVRPDRSVIGCKEHADVNYALTVESSVLLKNDGILPLKRGKIAVIGPNADDLFAQYGDWSYHSHPLLNPNAPRKETAYTLLQGLQEVYGKENVLYAKGCSVDNRETPKESEMLFKQGIKTAKKADVVVLALGDNLAWNGEEKDIAQPILRGRQIELLKAIKALGKPIVTVLINGKPLILEEVEKDCNAIVESFNSGDFGGLALAKLLKGEENFSGKLPISFPRAAGDSPTYYNQYDYWHGGGKYRDTKKGSEYPFGFGLSYSQFEVENLQLSKTEIQRGEKTELSLTLKNVSDREGKEVVQLYFRDKVCKVLTPVRQLCDFKKVSVLAHSGVTVTFTVDVEELGYYDRDCNYCVDAGEFELFVSVDGKQFASTVLTLLAE